jgi:hypothetical protein
MNSNSANTFILLSKMPALQALLSFLRLLLP